MKVSSWDGAVGAIRAVTLTVEDLLPQRAIGSVWELIDAGELGIAFENLCTQLYEYEITPDEPSREVLTRVGTYFRLEPGLWRCLTSEG